MKAQPLVFENRMDPVALMWLQHIMLFGLDSGLKEPLVFENGMDPVVAPTYDVVGAWG